MNDQVIFNLEVNKLLKNKFKAENWSGVSPVFYKNDTSNLVKCIEIRKSVKQDNFYCYLSLYSNFKNSNAPKKLMDSNKQIFLVTLTPNKVTDTSYYWPLKENKAFNENQIHLLWEAITNHGEAFFNRFNNFPEPFLHIRPTDFKHGNVKLFNTYEVYNQFNYMNFLKEIYISLNEIDMATSFSKLAIETYRKKIEKNKLMTEKKYKKIIKAYLNFLDMP
ncbi:hypothetical protein BWZ22_02415 [Seonamhaeicola sp. S2-3]|uniref:hypothetical protein n=1 Tax=Seonamhaeicola sp. S2-3 TaxID=1936081 RepID=UPI000972DEA3|nr:hypothetical protein [Seonamhaeicola sp. S2-3]APY10156.1 hypothetical protein BWZ22_02415 [Seonamhaeicola sp. S2-3]